MCIRDRVNVLDAKSKVKVTLNLMVIWTILTWVLTPLFIVYFGYNGVALASFLVTLSIGYTVYLVKKIINFNFINSIYKPLVSSLIMSLFVYSFLRILPLSLIVLLFVILVGGLVYFTCIYLLAKDELYQGMKVFKRSKN